MTTGQYFDDEPSVASDPRPVEISLPDLAITLTADRGVFSAEHLDAGTKLLLQESPPLTTADRTILDLGCGWGPIACVAAAGTSRPNLGGRCQRASASAHRRQRRNDRCWDRITVAAPDEVGDDVRFDRILSNPPIRIGKQALTTFSTAG